MSNGYSMSKSKLTWEIMKIWNVHKMQSSSTYKMQIRRPTRCYSSADNIKYIGRQDALVGRQDRFVLVQATSS